MDIFLDSPTARPRETIHIVSANEKVKPREAVPSPDVAESRDAGAFRILEMEALVRIKLTAFGDKDRTHLRDLIDVRLIDASPARFPPELSSRLQQLLDTPEG